MAKRIFILCLLALLNGCSLLRLSYNNGPQLTWWWIDSYVGFNREHTVLAKQAIHEWFDWHRDTQLLRYADWLAVVREQTDGIVTPAQVCQWSDEFQNMIAPAIDYAVQLSAPMVLDFNKDHWRHIERRFAKSNDELRSDFLQPDLSDRHKTSVKRTVKRIKNLYGDISEAQRQLIEASVEASPFKPEHWLAERQRRQQVILQIFAQLVEERISIEHATIVLRNAVEHTIRSDDPVYRAYQLEMTAFTCDFVARMHNSTDQTQRQHMHKKLKNWEDDLRVLFHERPRRVAVETQ